MARAHAYPGMLERPSGVPPRFGMGAARNELLSLLLAVMVFATILIAFWIEAYR